jgi:hypothetical protein
MNSNVNEINPDKREESINLDLNASTYSEINMKNTSFYSNNEQLGNEFKFSNVNDYIKSKSDKRMEIDTFKMLPYYIEKVSKNIQYLDDLIKKQNAVSDASVLNNSQLIPAVENLNDVIKRSVDNVNEVLANNKNLAGDKKKLGHTSGKGSISLDTKNLFMTANKFDVIDEKEEDLIARKESINVNDKLSSLNKARDIKKTERQNLLLTTSAKKFNVNSVKTLANTNNSLSSKYKTNNTTIGVMSSASKAKTNSSVKKPGLSLRADSRSSAKDLKSNFNTYNTTKTTLNKDASILKKNLNNSKLNAQIKTTNIGNNKTLTNHRQTSMTNMRNKINSVQVEKVNLRRVISPSPYMTAPSQNIRTNSLTKNITRMKMAAPKNSKLNQSGLSINQSLNIGNKISGKCKCVCTCQNGTKNGSSSFNINKVPDTQILNGNTIALTEFNCKLINLNESQAEIKNQLKKLYGMYLISTEFSNFNSAKNNGNTESSKDSKLLGYMKNTLKSIKLEEEESDGNHKQILNGMNLSANYNSNNSNSGALTTDRRKELNKRRDEIKSSRIVQIQRKWREFLIKKNFSLNNFSLKSSVKSQTIKSCKEKIYNMLSPQEKLSEIVQLINKANRLWTEINESSSKIFSILPF